MPKFQNFGRVSWVTMLLLSTFFLPRLAHADFPWFSAERRARIRCEREAKWAMYASDPAGTRQLYKYGKQWPPYPRPVGPEQKIVHRYHGAHYWPYPYVEQDRCYIRSLSYLQTHSGWVAETTLYDYHFDPETQLVNHAGVMKLQWILLKAPVEHRTVFVQQAVDSHINDVRLASVQAESAKIVGDGNLPPILLRVSTPLTRPTNEIDAIRRAELDSQPIPRIEYAAPTAVGP